MLLVSKKNYTPYQSIINSNTAIVEYKDIFSKKIMRKVIKKLNNEIVDCLIVGIAAITRKIFSLKPNDIGGIVCFIPLEDDVLKVLNKKSGQEETIILSKGSVYFLGSRYIESNMPLKNPQKIITLFETNPIKYAFLRIKTRKEYRKEILAGLIAYKQKPEWNQCLHLDLKLDKMIGSGCYGSVYKADVDNRSFAVKLSTMKEGDKEKIKNSSWHELTLFYNFINPIISKNICPNLPYLYEYFTCDNCDITIKDKNKKGSCIITAVELATEDLDSYVKSKILTDDIYLNMLFQIMAGIHSIQKYGSILNFDLKRKNILCYDVEPGGYWHYRIRGVDFYVPNMGKIFIVNDFGISKTYNPYKPLYKDENIKTYSLGSRYGIVKDNEIYPLYCFKMVNIDGNTVDSDKITWNSEEMVKRRRKTISLTTKGAVFRMKRETEEIYPYVVDIIPSVREFLQSNNIPLDPTKKEFFNSEIIPPFEFYNDTQDCIRMFIGGKRTTQSGNHGGMEISDSLKQKLQKYNGPSDSAKDRIFSKDASQLLAGNFIQSFFTNHTTYTIKQEDILDSYIIS